MHISTACEQARAIQADSDKPLIVGVLASLGSNGKFASHQERDMRNWLRDFTNVNLEVYDCYITMEIHGIVQKELMPMMLIHEVFAECMKAGMERIFYTDFRDVGEYWAEMMQSEYGRNHSSVADAEKCDFLQWTIPLVLHHDDVEAFKEVPFTCFNFSSPLVSGDPWLRKLAIFCLETNHMVEFTTYAELSAIMIWSLKWVALGRYPPAGFYGEQWPVGSRRRKLAGTPLCRQWRAAFVGMKSDLKAEHELHGFQRYYLCKLICKGCFATKIPEGHILTYKNLRPNALHRLTRVSHEDYLRDTPPHKRSPWVAHPDWTIDRNFGDNLHLLFVGGVAKDMVGVALMEVALVERFWQTPELQTNAQQLRAAWKESAVGKTETTWRRLGLGIHRKGLVITGLPHGTKSRQGCSSSVLAAVDGRNCDYHCWFANGGASADAKKELFHRSCFVHAGAASER